MKKSELLGLYLKEKASFKLCKALELGLDFDRYIKERGYSKKELASMGENELRKAEKEGVLIVFYEEKDFPEELRQIPYPPMFFYIKGNLKTDGLLLAIIGSRSPTQYGMEVARYFSKELASAGIGIVSGFARGIDTISHKSCLEVNGYTIGILGCGLDICYPAENRSLFEKIVESGGALVSEFPFGTKPFKENFPRRNRIISGLSHGVLVVEAGKKSGTLLTVKWALSQGKEIFAIPGNIFSSQSEGTHLLIKEGAIPVTTPKEILDHFGIVSKEEVKNAPPSLNEEELKIVKNLSSYPMHLEELISKVELPSFEVLSLITDLELKGVVEVLPGKFVKLKETGVAR
jgi:DNA processing protein